MAVVTISREFGSGGQRVAEKVAQALGYHLVDKQFIGTVLSQYGLVEFGKEYETLPGFWEKFDAQREKRRDVMVNMLNQVVRAVAHHGDVVILGRSGFTVLGDFADVLHVRFQAPPAVRAERVLAQQEMTAAQAQAAVRDNDRLRAAFVEGFYGVSWQVLAAFDLVINTGKVSPDLATTWIVDAVRALAAGPPAGRPDTATIEVDPILAAAVSDALGCSTAHR